MFFLTAQDPNFRIKGSRDPLGFQPIWQSLGRSVIKYVSTVSNNIRDFQILSFAWYFYGDRDPKQFYNFFIKFEQAYGFARGIYIENDAFNGIEFVRKNMQANSFTFSAKTEHTLLSNQKSYGIFGKYNRPFSEMNIRKHPEFVNVMERALQQKGILAKMQKTVATFLKEDEITLFKNDLELFATSIEALSPAEIDFYTETILKTNDNHVQNNIFQILEEYPAILHPEVFNLFQYLDAISIQSDSDALISNLDKIIKAEKVLTSYAYLFRTLQTAAVWQTNTLEELSIFDSFPEQIAYQFKHPVLDELNTSLATDDLTIAEKVIERNITVSEARKNASWIKKEKDNYVVCYPDGARNYISFDSEVDFENNYFFPSYISLYKQIRGLNE